MRSVPVQSLYLLYVRSNVLGLDVGNAIFDVFLLVGEGDDHIATQL